MTQILIFLVIIYSQITSHPTRMTKGEKRASSKFLLKYSTAHVIHFDRFSYP